MAKAALVVVVLGVCGGAETSHAKTGAKRPLPGDFGESILAMSGAPNGAIVVRGDDIYWTTMDGNLMREPRAAGGGVTKVLATMADGLQADERGLYYAEPDGLYLLPLGAGEQKPIRISPLAKTHLMAGDADSLYCVVPNYSFDPTPNYGVYRVEKRGGEAKLLWRPSAPHDEPVVAVEGADVYVASSADGVIYQFDKASGKRTTFLRGPRKVGSMAADATYLYWHSGRTADVRRAARKGGGGKTDVVGRHLDTELVVAHASGAYWFEGGPGKTGYRLMRLSAGAAAPVPVATDLNMPAGLTVDEGSVYFGDVERRLIVRLPLAAAAVPETPAAQSKSKGDKGRKATKGCGRAADRMVPARCCIPRENPGKECVRNADGMMPSRCCMRDENAEETAF